jgi:nucleoside-diphosphate-sugar epimerase
VPLAKDRALFEQVNVGGMANLLTASADAGVIKLVYTSSSAVFGIPDRNPVDEKTHPKPVEAYGRAKYEAEKLCTQASRRGIDVTVIRPRTILGHGRLGVFSILFDWIADGSDVFVLGAGDNIYQFVHAEDLADACIAASKRAGPAIYNVGAAEFGTMRQSLEALVAHAGSGSRVRSLPMRPTVAAMKLAGSAGLAPFAPYHWIMYGRSLYFDITKAEAELDWKPQYSNVEMLVESYEWFLSHRLDLGQADGASAHRSPVQQGALRIVKKAIRRSR